MKVWLLFVWCRYNMGITNVNNLDISGQAVFNCCTIDYAGENRMLNMILIE